MQNETSFHPPSRDRLQDILSMYGLAVPNVIIAGNPLSTMTHSAASRALAVITTVLSSHGRFIACHLSNRIMSLCEPFTGTGRMEPEFFDIPAMRVFHRGEQGV